MKKRFPNNPLQEGNFGDDYDSSDVVALLDRMRRNSELMNGSVDQEDASFQDRVEVADGITLEVTIKPTAQDKWLLVDDVAVNPAKFGVEYEIVADSEKTDANVFSSSIPKVVRDKIKITISNVSGAVEKFVIQSDAREIRKSQR